MRHVLARLAIAVLALAIAAAWAQEPQQTPGAQPTPEQNSPQNPQSGSLTASQQKTPEPLPENPTPQKESSDNTVQAAKEMAETGLKRARDWESNWIAGIYVGRNRKLVPLNREERLDYYLRQTFTRPEDYLKRMFAAGVDQARGVPHQWDDGWAGYTERFASREGQFFTSNSIAALGNAKLGYEVRYDKCKCDRFKQRLHHAIMRNFLTYDQSEGNLRPQWALYGGAFGGGLLSTAWKPSPKNAWANGGWAVLGQAAYGSLVNLITEFSTEINRKQGVKK